MKLFHNKKVVSATAIVMMLVLMISVISMNSSTVLAARFPGVDYLIKDNTTENPMNILEIVSTESDARFGFYIDGQEPFGIDEAGNALSFEEVLVSMNDKTEREAYVNALLQKLYGKYGAQGSAEFPITYEAYEEKYFLKDGDVSSEWTELVYDEYKSVKIKGHYEPVPTAEDGSVVYGDYLLESSTYEPVSGETVGTHVEDIAAFQYIGADSNYDVTFTDVETEGKPEFGTYIGSYIEVGRMGEENSPVEGSFYIQNAETQAYELVDIVTEPPEAGTVLYSREYTLLERDLAEGEVPYYVKSYQFSNKAGKYAPIYKNDTEHFRPIVEGEIGTHIKIEGKFVYAPGQGDHYFVEEPDNPEAPECDVQIPSFYYKGGFANNNWFSLYVLTLTGNDLTDNRMSIHVQTKVASEVTPDDLVGKDLIVMSTGTVKQEEATPDLEESAPAPEETAAIFDLSADTGEHLASLIKSAALPCIVNSDFMKNTTSNLYTHLNQYVKEDVDGNYVNGSVYWYTGDILVNDLMTVWTTAEALAGFEEIKDYIDLENQFLKLEDKELLATDISRAVAIQYILGKQAARVITEKTKLTVLEVEPCADYVVTDVVVRNVTRYQYLKDEDIDIDHMTTAEFIGKIDDLNGKYDFIYIGMQTGRMNKDSAGNTVYNDSSMNGLIYTHTGDAVIAEGRLAGLLDTDYVFNMRPQYRKLSSGKYEVLEGTGFYPYDKEVYKLRTYKDADGILRVGTQDVDYKVNNPGDTRDEDGTYELVTVGNVGVYRYSGNDITEEKMEHLLTYMDAGYPVVLADGFFTGNTERGKRTVNAGKVDNSSYLYQFANAVINKDNLFREGDIITNADTDENNAFEFYMNIPKLNINYYDGGSLPTSALLSDNGGVARYLQPDSSGRYHLSYTFKIENEAAAQPTETKYTVALFVDINSDGRYSRTMERMDDLLIYEAGNPENTIAVNELEEGVLYTVTRQLPSDFASVIPWKLEVSQTANECIRNSIVGYSAIEKSEPTDINILQIIPNSGNTWDFANDTEFQTLLKELKDIFNITITTSKVSDIDGLSDPFGTLNDYDMLILGFKDMYGEFTNESTAKAILKYIDTGKSVLFTHDTTSFVNTQDRKLDSRMKQGLFGLGSDNSTMSANEWGYYLNTEIRDALGMDRYGITSTETIGDSNTTIRDALRKGQILNPGLSSSDPDYDAYDKIIVKAIEDAQKDVAYVANSNRKQTYPEVQGYTYAALNLAKNDLKAASGSDINGTDLIPVETVNRRSGNNIIIEEDNGGVFDYFDEGVHIISYEPTDGNHDFNAEFSLTFGSAGVINPREIDWSDPRRPKTAGVNIANAVTGQLNLEYKSGDVSKIDPSAFKVYEVVEKSSEKTAALTTYLNLNTASGVNNMGSNNTYDYTTATVVNEGQITNYPFKIDEKFTVANTHAQYYQLDLEADHDKDGESDIVVWYCISDGGTNDLDDQIGTTTYLQSDDIYSASPNDVRNNYYIYSIGNVFYTGVGHSNVSAGNSINEKKLFINTMVAAYASSTVKPEVTALSAEDVMAPAATSIAVPVELLTDNDGNLRKHGIDFYYSVFDSNLVSGSLISDNKKVLTARYYIEDPEGKEEINGVKVKDITGNVITESQGEHLVPREDDSYIVQSGQAYTCSWVTRQLKELLDVKERFNLYIKVTSTFTHNGEPKELEGTDEILIKKVNLFELD